MQRFGQMVGELNKEYDRKLKSIKYLEKVFKFIKNAADHKVDEFVMTCPHGDGYDSEFRIESYAKEFGYKVIDEEIHSDKTIYKLRKE